MNKPKKFIQPPMNADTRRLKPKDYSPKTGLGELQRQGIFMDLFKKSGAEDIAYLMDAADDPLGNLVEP